MWKFALTVLFVAATVGATGCLTEPVPRGCTDSHALNRDFAAEEDDGSCEYSKVIFYKAVDGPPVQVSVDGVSVGTVNAFYPTGPGNCSAPGSAYHQLVDGESHDWNAQSGPFLSSGIVRSSTQECVRIRVF